MTTTVHKEMIASIPSVNTADIADLAVTNAKVANGTLTTAKQKMFESAEQNVSADVSISVAHGLGAAPKLFQAVLRNKTTEGGYAVGDEIFLAPSAAFGANATNVFAALNGLPSIVPKAGGVAAGITAANWKIVLRAWA